MSFVQILKKKLSEIGITFLSKISPRIGLSIDETEPNKLILSADASLPGRGFSFYLVLFSLLPFHSDFLEDPNDFSILNGYDFYNHPGAIPLRLCILLPGLWIGLVREKVMRCVFDKNSNTFLIEQKSYLTNQKSKGNFKEITELRIFEVEKSKWFPFDEEELTDIQIDFLRQSEKPISVTFIEYKCAVDRVIAQTYDRLSKFLELA